MTFNSILIAIFGSALLMPVCYILGRWVANDIQNEKSVIWGILYLIFGYGVFAYVLIGLSYLGLLKTYAVLMFVALTLTFGRGRIKEFISWFILLFQPIFLKGNGKFLKFCQIIFLITIVSTFLICFLPEIGNDSLAHNLNLAKRYVQLGKIGPIEYDFKSYQTILMNSLYTIGILFNSIPLAKLFHWWTGIFLALLLLLWIEKETGNKKFATFFGLILWLTPTLINEVTTTYVDVAVALFTFTSFYLLFHHDQKNALKAFFLSGLAIGFATNVKFSGLLALFANSIIMAGILITGKTKNKLKLGFSFLVGALLGGGFLYIRNWILTGNPVFPALGSFFGGAGSILTEDLLSLGVPKTLLNFILIPWHITFNLILRDSHIELKYFDIRNWIGPFYFCAIPFFIHAIMKEKKMIFGLLFILSYLVGWFFIGQTERYLLPILPIYLVISSVGIWQLSSSKRLRKVGQLGKLGQYVASGFILLLFAISVYHYRYQYWPILTFSKPNAYLNKMERTYPMAQWSNQHLPAGSKILSNREIRLFYFDHQIVREIMLDRFTNYSLKNSSEMHNFLKSHGFTHILETQIDPPTKLQEKKLDQILSNPHFTTRVVTIRSKSTREPQYSYLLYELV